MTEQTQTPPVVAAPAPAPAPTPKALSAQEQAWCAQAHALGFKYFVVGKKLKPVFANTEAECEADKKKLHGEHLKVYILKATGWAEVI